MTNIFFKSLVSTWWCNDIIDTIVWLKRLFVIVSHCHVGNTIPLKGRSNVLIHEAQDKKMFRVTRLRTTNSMTCTGNWNIFP